MIYAIQHEKYLTESIFRCVPKLYHSVIDKFHNMNIHSKLYLSIYRQVNKEISEKPFKVIYSLKQIRVRPLTEKK